MASKTPESPEQGAQPDGERGRARVVARRLEQVLDPVVETLGYELVLVDLIAARPRVVRLYIDHADGVTVEDCARVSRVVSNALDAAEQGPASSALSASLAAPYTLEVSSPGLDRPLCRRSHFERFAGHVARVRTKMPLVPGAARRNFQGRIEGVEPDPERPSDDRAGTVVIRAIDDSGLFRIPLAEMSRASLVYEG
jgi:ribosome maturation factor RimP